MQSPRNYSVHLNTDVEFKHTVPILAADVDFIVETGTRYGDGSTLVLATTGKPVTTIECNPNNHHQAVTNLSTYPNVTCILGYSLFRQKMFDFIDQDSIYDSNLPIMFDNLINPREYYKIEIGNQPIQENVLINLIDNSIRQLILLDSAGGVGWLEYLTVVSLSPEKLQKKILILDDIGHVKHYRSVIDLDNRYMGFFHKSDSGRWGWIDFSKITINNPY